jgi:threonine dehydrogenase-like Zn-dependent dehydrogenase
MKTLVLEQPGRLAETDTDLPPATPPEGMALVRVRRVGVCGTDFHAWHGRQPFFTFPRVLGHELGVEVVAVGAGESSVGPGDRCSVEPYLHCGGCGACRRGRTNCCERMQVMGVHVDGGMREQLLVPLGKLHPSSSLDLETLALVETLSVGAHAVRRGSPAAGDQTLVIGAGPIGLSVTAFALERGADVVVMDVSDARLAFVARALPGARTLKAPADQVADAVRAAFGGAPPLLVFDATGHRGSMCGAITLAAHGGTVVYVGLFAGDVTFPDPEFHKRELTLMGSRNATADDFRHVIAALEGGRVDVTPWITHRAALADVPAVFPSWTDPATGVVKALIEL